MFRLMAMTALAGAFMFHAPSTVTAQVASAAGQAQAEARARVACGAATLVSAQYLPGGLLRVTCSQQGQQQGSNAAQATIAGTGLATAPVLGAVLGVTLIGIVGGGGNPSQTTTTPQTTNSSSFSASR
ncbi:MAG: hypothetical protein AB3N11_11245 [Arenibacterium sp.]